ncbi:MAG: SGNH/GDSL hydrolase family protein [Solirubrobacteraceae bacterium]
MLVAALGDSITAGSPIWDPDPQVRAQIGSALDERSQYEYWATRRLRVPFRNCGVFGERVEQIALRLDACARGARYLIVQGGINDIAQGRSVADAARGLEGIVRRAQALGLGVELVEVLPWNNGYPGAAGPIEQLNRLIAQIGARARVPVLGFYRALEDPRAPGRMRADLTIDGNHPSVSGYRILGGLVALPPAPAGRG